MAQDKCGEAIRGLQEGVKSKHCLFFHLITDIFFDNLIMSCSSIRFRRRLSPDLFRSLGIEVLTSLFLDPTLHLLSYVIIPSPSYGDR